MSGCMEVRACRVSIEPWTDSLNLILYAVTGVFKLSHHGMGAGNGSGIAGNIMGLEGHTTVCPSIIMLGIGEPCRGLQGSLYSRILFLKKIMAHFWFPNWKWVTIVFIYFLDAQGALQWGPQHSSTLTDAGVGSGKSPPSPIMLSIGTQLWWLHHRHSPVPQTQWFPNSQRGALYRLFKPEFGLKVWEPLVYEIEY